MLLAGKNKKKSADTKADRKEADRGSQKYLSIYSRHCLRKQEMENES